LTIFGAKVYITNEYGAVCFLHFGILIVVPLLSIINKAS